MSESDSPVARGEQPASADRGDTDTPESDGLERTDSDARLSVSLLRVAAGVGGAGMAGSYLLTWVTVVETEATVAGDGVGDRAIGAGEIHLLPAVVAVLGLAALAVVAVRWTRPAHLSVLSLGILGLSASLYLRGFVDSGNQDIIVAGRRAPASAFEPAIGLTLALVMSTLLLATGLGAFAGSFDRWPRGSSD